MRFICLTVARYAVLGPTDLGEPDETCEGGWSILDRLRHVNFTIFGCPRRACGLPIA